jgi:hypothetical protein
VFEGITRVDHLLAVVDAWSVHALFDPAGADDLAASGRRPGDEAEGAARDARRGGGGMGGPGGGMGRGRGGGPGGGTGGPGGGSGGDAGGDGGATTRRGGFGGMRDIPGGVGDDPDAGPDGRGLRGPTLDRGSAQRAVQLVVLAFLDERLRDNPAAREWLAVDAPVLLRQVVRLEARGPRAGASPAAAAR